MIFNPDACENCKAHIQTAFGRIKLAEGGEGEKGREGGKGG